MGRANMSLWGLYTYNPSLFDGFTVPVYDGSAVFDKQDFIDNLILDTEGLEVLYSDPDFMQAAITAWSSKQAPVWEELAATLYYEYDPIENYYRRESWDDNYTHGHAKNSTLTHGHKVTMDVDDTTVNSVTGYNGSTFGDHDKTVFTNDDTETHSGTDTTAETNTGTDRDHKEGYARGNIGVTTTQQMIEAQRDVVRFNLMDHIIDDFKNRFTLLIY